MISDRLKKIIAKLDLSQKDFANSVGLTPSSLNDILNGRTKGISNTLQIAIKFVHGVNIDWLLTGEGEMFSYIQSQQLKDMKKEYVKRTMSKSESKKEHLFSINGSVGIFPSITDVEQIAHTSWYENMSDDKQFIIAAIEDEDMDAESLKELKQYAEAKIKMARALKKTRSENKLRKKGETG